MNRCRNCGRFAPWAALEYNDRMELDLQGNLLEAEWFEHPQCPATRRRSHGRMSDARQADARRQGSQGNFA